MTNISIAMATLNGGRFLEEQLGSLARQTCLPAELVIGDDGSSDDTLAKIDRFAQTSPFPVRVHRNETRMGYRLNFMAVAARCRSPLIAFCDQDDIWRADKLEKLAAAFSDPDVMLVQHNARVVDAGGRPISALLGPGAAPPPVQPAMTGSPWDFPFGLTLAFRAELAQFNALQLRSLDPLHSGELLAHDQWIALLAWMSGTRVYLPEHLVDYRMHEANTFGVGPKPGRTALERMHLAVTDRSGVYRRLAEVAEANAWIFAHAGAPPARSASLRSGSRTAADRWSELARLYRLRQAVYTEANPLRRLNALLRLVQEDAYGSGGLWSFGAKSLLRDILLGALFGPLITALGAPQADRDASLRGLQTRARPRHVHHAARAVSARVARMRRLRSAASS